ncbi:MAG: hypothetical protein J6X80_04260 [Lachnospiraceae bacterium]|nr:hypothetical protein [Lachnospiraceae bacterium]
MGNKLNNKNVGIACVILGGLFLLGGIVLFILYNSVNLYAQKADATIVSKYRVESEDDPHTVLELAYRVGDDMVYATDSYYGEIDDETVNLEIYYNVKDPKQILEAGWHFEPIIPSVFGVIILLTGLYYMGLISFGFEPAKKPGKDSSDWDKKYYAAKEKAENALIPMLGVISFVVFGVFLVVKKTGWWAWIFVAVGAIGIIYLLTDLIPAASELGALRRIKKVKGKAVSVDDDFENFEKEKNKGGKAKAKDTVSEDKETVKEEIKETPKEYEVEDTFEIKTLDVKKNKKKKQ